MWQSLQQPLRQRYLQLDWFRAGYPPFLVTAVPAQPLDVLALASLSWLVA
jgi:hypothetical protein